MSKAPTIALGGILAGVALAGGGMILFGGKPLPSAGQPTILATPKPLSQATHGSAQVTTGVVATTPLPVASPAPTIAVKNVLSAYSQRNYSQAERAARVALATAPLAHKPASASPITRRERLRLRKVLAFTIARQGKMKEAQAQFAALATEARQVPEGKERPTPELGQGEKPTIAEDAAFQHAVCTMALGDKAGAEKEFLALIRTYPESPIVHASVKRIARLHEGNIPAEATKTWQQAMEVVKKRAGEKRRQAAMCAPACVRELLRRQGKSADLESLAQEMKTTAEGTSVDALLGSLKQRGYPKAEGVALSSIGLRAQKLPLIALVAPGHFVLVEKIATDGSVTIWDANNTTHTGEARTLTATQWQELWQGGVALTLSAPQPLDTKEV